ncbi:hypothetical protein SALBM135S_07416 [Streptomyces alboniger]
MPGSSRSSILGPLPPRGESRGQPRTPARPDPISPGARKGPSPASPRRSGRCRAAGAASSSPRSVVYLIANIVLSFFNEGDGPTISYTEFDKQVAARQRHQDLLQGRRDPGAALNSKQPVATARATTPSSPPSVPPSPTTTYGRSSPSRTSPSPPNRSSRSAASSPTSSSRSAPMLLLVVLWVAIASPGCARAWAARAACSAARPRPDPSNWRPAPSAHHLRRRRRHRRGRGRAQRRRRLPQEPARLPRHGRQDASRRAPRRASWAPARPCSPAPSPARPECRSSPPAPSSSR